MLVITPTKWPDQYEEGQGIHRAVVVQCLQCGDSRSPPASGTALLFLEDLRDKEANKKEHGRSGKLPLLFGSPD